MMDFFLITVGLIIIIFIGGMFFDGEKGSRIKGGKKALNNEAPGIVIWIVFGGMFILFLYALSEIF
jgi:hypothetical protein